MSKFTAIVLSGGTGKRMNSDIPKQYMMLKDKPVLAHSLLAFEKSPVDDVVIVCGAGDEEYIIKEFVEKYGLTKVSAVCAGGAERFAGGAAWRPVVGDAADGEVVVGVGVQSSEREGVGVHCRDVSVEAHHEGT